MQLARKSIPLLIALGLVAPLPAALAKRGDVIVRAKCSANSTAKLTLSPENGRLEVEFEVDQNRNGVSWNWALARPGKTVASGTRITRAPSGSFEVRRVLNDKPGTDRIIARATRASGEVCSVSASF